ncbi:protein of unknown function [Legionella fallonii LLAP-10]|uniref:Uncharacterized protein n=1 Tax=Legionella fallonii LLAP-10 TaxID=1212491 RepID=A0A098G3S2_9GAMM|nr:protein of unknown function [Legionella fallonii LLAP-10]
MLHYDYGHPECSEGSPAKRIVIHLGDPSLQAPLDDSIVGQATDCPATPNLTALPHLSYC